MARGSVDQAVLFGDWRGLFETLHAKGSSISGEAPQNSGRDDDDRNSPVTGDGFY